MISVCSDTEYMMKTKQNGLLENRLMKEASEEVQNKFFNELVLGVESHRRSE